MQRRRRRSNINPMIDQIEVDSAQTIATNNPRKTVEEFLERLPTATGFDEASTSLALMDRGHNPIVPQIIKKIENGNPILNEVAKITAKEVAQKVSSKYGIEFPKALEQGMKVTFVEDRDFSETGELEDEKTYGDTNITYIEFNHDGKMVTLPIVKLMAPGSKELGKSYAIDSQGRAYYVYNSATESLKNQQIGFYEQIRMETRPAQSLNISSKMKGKLPTEDKNTNFFSNHKVPIEVGKIIPEFLQFDATRDDIFGYYRNPDKPTVYENKLENPNLPKNMNIQVIKKSTASIDGIGGMKNLARRLAPNTTIK